MARVFILLLLLLLLLLKKCASSIIKEVINLELGVRGLVQTIRKKNGISVSL
jgi:hypothetical protein